MLIGAIEQGVASTTWGQETFAYADAFDDAKGRYLGLRAGEHVHALIDSSSVVVRPEVSRMQMDEGEDRGSVVVVETDGGGEGEELVEVGETGKKAPRRFFGTASVDPVRMSRDAGQIADEIVKHLVGLVDAAVDVRIEIEATDGRLSGRRRPYSH